MNASILEVLTENERRANRSCAIAGLWTAAVCLVILTSIPHAAFGLPISSVEEANIPKFSAFLADGSFDRLAYWKGLQIWCVPSLSVCLAFFAIILNRICRDGHEALAHQARVYARLADVEKGLAIAATMEAMRDQGSGIGELNDGARGMNQPEVGDWSTEQIIECISRCKERAAADPEFASLVERDPAAAVREVQA